MAITIIDSFPKLKPELWANFSFETKTRYYNVILQQDLFNDWIIVKSFGRKRTRLGNSITEHFSSYSEAIIGIENIKKRRKIRKYSVIK